MRPARVTVLVVLAGLAPLVGLVACGSSDSGADVAARAFLARWSRGEYRAAGRYTDAAPGKVAAELRRAGLDLDPKRASFRLESIELHGNRASARFRAALELGGGLGVWRYTGELGLEKAGGRWRVVWRPSVIHPRLRPGLRLVAFRQLPPRAPILDRDGRALVVPRPIVTVGVVPSLLARPRLALHVLQETTGADPARVRSMLATAGSNQFVPVITLRRSDYERVRARIHPLPGVHFQTGSRPLAPTREFARPVLGIVGPATSEALKVARGPYTAADEIGLSGLQQVYQRRLAGTPSGGVILAGPSGRRLATLFTAAGSPGRPVQTTLDEDIQMAAESALGGVKRPAALVAVDASTGRLLAIANRPADSFDRALTGLYPPGSSFKVATAEALLAGGLDPNAAVSCPAAIVVGGVRFTNFESEVLGRVPFSVDFAKSCNTAFVGLAGRVTAGRLAAAARLLGIGASYRLPLPATSGGVPQPASEAEHAADMIGQGRVLASPLAMALVAAAVDAGVWHPPALVTTPPPTRSAVHQVPLKASIAEALRRLMRAVVTEGTGTAASLPGEPVYGKTGTAEFGTGAHPRTHAWFIGFRGSTAFAAVVEGGGIGGRVAAPIAARFLRAIG